MDVKEGINLLLFIGTLSFPTALIGYEAAKELGTMLFRKKIASQEELEKVVEEEARKLDLDLSKIDAQYHVGNFENFATNVHAYAMKIDDINQYEVKMKKGRFSTRATVRHELYHIYKRDCDKPFYLRSIISEPRAMLYGCFNIKI